MIVKSLNLIAPNIDNTLYNISVNNSGVMVIAQNIDPNAIGINSIQLSEKYTLRLTEDGSVELVDKEFLTSPEYVPLWFYSPNGTTYRVTAEDPGILSITQASYVRQSGTPFYAIYCRFLSKITDDLLLDIMGETYGSVVLISTRDTVKCLIGISEIRVRLIALAIAQLAFLSSKISVLLRTGGINFERLAYGVLLRLIDDLVLLTTFAEIIVVVVFDISESLIYARV
jgi:hypothetical protein